MNKNVNDLNLKLIKQFFINKQVASAWACNEHQTTLWIYIILLSIWKTRLPRIKNVYIFNENIFEAQKFDYFFADYLILI